MKQSLYAFSIISFTLFFLSSCGSDSQKTTDIRDEVDTLEQTSIEATPTSNPSPNTLPNEEDFFSDYENTNRVVWQKLDMVIGMMGDLSNKVIADIGAGTGHFSLPLVKKAKKVIAIDIDKEMINFIDQRKVMELPEDIQGRLESRLTSADTPGLQVNEVDIAVIVNTYMWVSNRVEWSKKILSGIKPGGKVFVIDFKKKKTPLGPDTENRVPLHTVEQELEEAGFINIQSNDTVLDYQYIIVAEKKM